MPSVLQNGCSELFNRLNADRKLTEKGANCYKASVLRALMWSRPYLFHRVIHIFCGIDLPLDS